MAGTFQHQTQALSLGKTLTVRGPPPTIIVQRRCGRISYTGDVHQPGDEPRDGHRPQMAASGQATVLDHHETRVDRSLSMASSTDKHWAGRGGITKIGPGTLVIATSGKTPLRGQSNVVAGHAELQCRQSARHGLPSIHYQRRAATLFVRREGDGLRIRRRTQLIAVGISGGRRFRASLALLATSASYAGRPSPANGGGTGRPGLRPERAHADPQRTETPTPARTLYQYWRGSRLECDRGWATTAGKHRGLMRPERLFRSAGAITNRGADRH